MTGGGGGWSRWARAAGALAGLLALACGGGDVVHLPPSRERAFEPLSTQLFAGDSAAIGVSLASGGAGARAVITSADPSIAEPSVTTLGADGVLYVRGRSPGATTLTIEIRGERALTGTLPVLVLARPTVPVAISASPSVRTLGVGDTARLVATAIATSASTELRVTFHSRDTSVVTVDSAGLMTARRIGVATVVVARVSDPRLSSRQEPPSS